MTHESASPEPADRSVNEVLERLHARRSGTARYRMAGEVARGGMGAILQVWDEDLRRPLAMKVALSDEEPSAPQPTSSSPASRVDQRRLSRFLEEAQITGQLEHPGIVPVHELGVDERGRAFFTMRLVRGRDLEQIFQLVDAGAENWTVTRAVGVLQRVCEAMAFAHDRRVLHRDLKPANVMVGPFGEVYVMDWGIARVLGEPDRHDVRVRVPAQPPASAAETTAAPVATDRRDRASGSGSNLYTMDGDVIGSPAYMSPEQARGLVDELDARSDVYSVGAMLYRLLGGRAPHTQDGRSVLEVLRGLVAGPPEPLGRLNPRAPAELVAIAEKAMAHDPEQRYPTMLALADDLRAFLENRVVAAHATGPWAEAKKWIGRNRALAASLLAAVLLLAGGLVTSLWLKAAADREAARADRERLAALESGRRAEREAAVASAVNAFLNDDVLAAVAPEHMGANVTVREVLQQSALQLDWSFAGQPVVEAALRMTIGTSFARLGEPAEARRHLERALALREREFGPNAEETLEARLRLAATTADLGDVAAAEAGYRAAREIAAATLGPEHLACLTADNDLALLYENGGRLAEARALFERTLATMERTLGPDANDTVTTRSNLGSLLTKMGELPAAESLLVAALAARERTLGDHDPLTLETRNALALLRIEQGRLAEAEPMLVELLRLREESHGEDHVACGRALTSLGTVRAQLGRFAAAIADNERACRILGRRLGDEHPWTLNAANNLAAALVEAGENERALPLRERTLDAQRRVLGPEHPQTLLSMSNLASLYNSLGRRDDAERLGRETVALQERVLGPDHPSTLVTRENLGGVLFARGDYAGSAALVQQVLDGRRETLGEEHPAVTRTLYNLAMIRKATGDTAGAEQLFTEVLAKNRRDLPAEHPAIADVLARLASLRSGAKDYDTAERYLQEALAIRQKAFAADAPECTLLMHELGVQRYLRGDLDGAIAQLRTALEARRRAHGDGHEFTQTTGYVLGMALEKAAHHADAEPLLLAWHRFQSATHGPDDPATHRAAKSLAELYEAWGRNEEASRWRERQQ